MKAPWIMRSVTTTPLRAIVVTAVIVVMVSSATIAFGAVGDGGTVTTCFSKATATWRPIDVASGVKCKSGEQQLTFYTKEKVDSLLGSLNFLTQTQADAKVPRDRRPGRRLRRLRQARRHGLLGVHAADELHRLPPLGNRLARSKTRGSPT